MKLPSKTHEGNLLFTAFCCYAVYELEGTQYNYISDDEKFKKRGELKKNILASKSNHIKILGKPVTASLREKNEAFKKTITGPLKKEAHDCLDAITNLLVEKSITNASESKRYLLIKLNTRSSMKLRDVFKKAFKDAASSISNIFNLEEFEITLEDLRIHKLAEQKLYNDLIRVKRANEMDLEWLVRQPFYRGLGEPKLRSFIDEGEEFFFKPSYRKNIKNGVVTLSPNKYELTTLAEGHVSFKNLERYLTVEHCDGRVSYQSFLAVSHLPPLWFPGNEWIYNLNKLPFPVEWEMDIDLVSNKSIKGKVGMRRKKTKDQIENAGEVRDLPEKIIEAEIDGKDIESEVEDTKEPHTFTNINFVVAADNLEELKSRVSALREYLYEFRTGEKRIEIQNPVSDQEKLFVEFLPGSTKQLLAYSRNLSIDALMSSMPTADDIIGEAMGFPIGFTGPLEKVVYFDPRVPALQDKSPAISSNGGLGGGKTHLAKHIDVITPLVGGKSVLIDPKCENVEWDKYIPFLKGHIELMKLSGSKEDKGKLDPFLVCDIQNKKGEEKEKAKNTAYESAVSIISGLLKAEVISKMSLAIQKACTHARDSDYPCMDRAVEFCREGYKESENLTRYKDDFDELYHHLENFRNFKTGSLLFGDENSKAITFEKLITIIQIQGLKIPKAKKEQSKYNVKEIVSQVVMGSIAGLLTKVAFSDNTTLKTITFDEYWFAKRSSDSEESLEEIQRTGRSVFTALHTIDQNPSGVSEEERNLIGTKFLYKTPGQRESESGLEFLDLEKTEKNLHMVRNMPKHHVLYQDHNKRTALIRIDLLFDIFNKAYSTRPVLKGDEDDE